VRKLLLFIIILLWTGPVFAQVIDTQSVSAQSTGACAAASSCAVFQIGSSPSVTLQVSGTFSGTLTFEATSDGTNWNTATLTKMSDNSAVTSTTSTGQFTFSNGGALQVRARATAWTSGTANVAATRGFSLARVVSGGSGGIGTVTSVALSLPSFISVSGSPVTTAGTLAGTLATQTANVVFAGPSSGGAAAPTFRTLVAGDLPAGVGTVTSVATTSPITGGPITSTGTIACATCGVTGSPLSQFAATTSAQLAGVISDELGSGKAIFANDGTSGQVLSTNGSGTLTFADVIQSNTTIVNNIKFANGKGITTDIHTNDTLPFQAYDTDDLVYRTFATLTAGTVPNFDIASPTGGTLSFTLGSDATGDIFYRNSSGKVARLGIGSSANVLTVAAGLPSWAAAPAGATVAQIGFTVDGAGAPITTGTKGFITVPYACTITKVTVLSTDASVTSGSIVVDIWKDTFANYPPTVADTIIPSGTKPTLSSATSSQSTSFTGWTTSISAGDILGFHVDSASTVTRITLILQVSIP